MPNLDRLAFQQGNKCFLCKRKVARSQQSVEHLLAKSLGGRSDEGNTVMVCKKVNNLLGNKPLKEKIAIIMAHGDDFRCPVLK